MKRVVKTITFEESQNLMDGYTSKEVIGDTELALVPVFQTEDLGDAYNKLVNRFLLSRSNDLETILVNLMTIKIPCAVKPL